MWKRTTKTEYGQIERITTGGKTAYDALPGITYTVEYLLQEYAEKANLAAEKNSGVGPWELYSTMETDSIGVAIRETIFRMFDEDCADCKLFVDVGDKDICAEIPRDTLEVARNAVQRGITRKVDRLENENVELKKKIALYKEFLASIPGGEKMFREWMQKEL